MRIDAHQHFWIYTAEEYSWIGPELSSLSRDFLPADLEPILLAGKMGGTVAVQARQTMAETRWLLNLATRHAWIKGVVGWVPLQDQAVAERLDEFSKTALKGVRHVVQGEPDPEFLRRGDFNRGIAEVTQRGLVYDILVFARQLSAVIEFVDRHPNQRFVVDHAAKPVVGKVVDANWRNLIVELGRRDHVACKFSGLATEAQEKFTGAEQLKPFFDVVLESFGPQRLLFGSDWPVCSAATNYLEWAQAVGACAAALSAPEKAALFGENADRIYQLS